MRTKSHYNDASYQFLKRVLLPANKITGWQDLQKTITPDAQYFNHIQGAKLSSFFTSPTNQIDQNSTYWKYLSEASNQTLTQVLRWEIHLTFCIQRKGTGLKPADLLTPS